MELVVIAEPNTGRLVRLNSASTETIVIVVARYGINQNLQKRYKQNKIYTYTGPILVAVNPYKELPYYGQDSVAR